MFELIKNAYMNKEDFNADINQKNFSIVVDKEEFIGEIMYFYDIPRLLKFDDNNFGIILSIDGWSTKNNYHFVIFKDNNNYVERFLKELDSCTYNTVGVLDTLNKYFEELIVQFKKVEVDDLVIPSGPDSTKFKETISGKLNIRKDYMSYGGYYGTDRYVHIGLVVGKGISNKESALISSIAMFISFFASKKLNRASYFNSNNTVGISGY